MNSKETIEKYLSEMLAWESAYYKIVRSDAHKNNTNNCRILNEENARAQLKSILLNFLSDKAYETMGKATLLTMAVGHPSKYDQKVENDFEEKPKTAVVISTPGNGGMMAKFCKYTLGRDVSGWKIKKIHTSHDQLEWRKNKAM